MQLRPLTQRERRIASSVFRDRLPYSRILVTDLVGSGGAPFTVVAPLAGQWIYTLNLGPAGYGNAAGDNFRHILVHELTHVWQGNQSSRPYMFMLNSVIHQGVWVMATGDRNRAYDYVAGQPWASYNVEQQAQIVEHWYVGGMRENDPLYTYIQENIRGLRRA